MTPETFFDRFELFAEVPGAVGKMREMVLELAVQGKLVAQSASDRSAIKCIMDAGDPVVPVVTFESVSTPPGWVAAQLGCVIASNVGGGTPSKSNPDYWDGSIPWASVKDITNDKYLTSTVDSITEQGLSKSSTNLIPTGRLIVVTRMGLGKLAINKIPVAINQDLRAIEPTAAFDIDFAYLLFKSLKLVGVGVTVKGVSVKSLHETTVILPPLAEQKRIVAKVDELMALCDRLEAQQRERATRHAALTRAALARFDADPTSANLDYLFHPSFAIDPADLRRSILALAVRGKLVPQDPHDKPLAHTKRSPKLIKRTAGCEQLSSPIDLPAGWSWQTMDSVFDVAGGIQKTPQREPRDNAYPYLGVSNVLRGRLDLSTVKRFQLAPGELERRRLEAGDLLVIEGNGSFNEIGRCAKWNSEIENCVHQNHVIRCRPLDTAISDFVLLFLNSTYGTAAMQARAITSSGLYTLSVGKIRTIEIPLPPLPEQRRIVTKVDELMARVDKLEADLAAARATATRLLDAAVAELTAPPADAPDNSRPGVPEFSGVLDDTAATAAS